MNEYTAVFDTEKMNGIHYSFDAENIEKAIAFCRWKFSPLNGIRLIAHNENDKEYFIKN